MQGDHAFALQLSECARDGLYRQTKVVGHVLSRHVKADFRVFGEPIVQGLKKRRDTLAGAFPPKQHQVRLRPFQLSSRQRPKRMADVGGAKRHIEQSATSTDDNLGTADRLCAQKMVCAGFETKNIAWQQEITDLTASISQHLVRPHAPRGHPIDKISCFAFAIDLCVPVKGHPCA